MSRISEKFQLIMVPIAGYAAIKPLLFMEMPGQAEGDLFLTVR
jgi:hypothetical protein